MHNANDSAIHKTCRKGFYCTSNNVRLPREVLNINGHICRNHKIKYNKSYSIDDLFTLLSATARWVGLIFTAESPPTAWAHWRTMGGIDQPLFYSTSSLTLTPQEVTIRPLPWWSLTFNYTAITHLGFRDSLNIQLWPLIGLSCLNNCYFIDINTLP
jgi:hypothetical protein